MPLTRHLVLAFGNWAFTLNGLFKQETTVQPQFSQLKRVIRTAVSLILLEITHVEARASRYLREMCFSSQVSPSQLFTMMFHLKVYLLLIRWLQVTDNLPVA